MYIKGHDLRTAIVELVDVFPIEVIESGVGPILDEQGNPILDTDNRPILDEYHA